MPYLYEELQAKGINAKTLPLTLAYSLPYEAKLDRLCGSENITYKPVKENKN